jgi:phosphoribosylaminoimidazolecarboxamide formyltransferase/IMP cyclohydrolase
VDEETAAEIAKLFVEAIAAPAYSEQALNILGAKKNLRMLKVSAAAAESVVKSISGGFLAQTPDIHRLSRTEIQVKSKRAPTDEEWTALEFGWKVSKHVKSNAIVYARAGQTVSVGAGQMSRLDSVKVAAMKAVLPLAGSMMASDAFFPFADGVEEAAKHGITAVIQPGGSVRDADVIAAAEAGATAVIQPGGSVRDAEVIAAADERNVAMVFTGIRHFRH